VERAYRHSTRVLGSLIAVLGVAMTVTTLARGGGPLALGVVLGVLFAVLGSARVYLAREGRSRDERP
jgi:drug/metabolite transporter (DMT)-like permease